MEIYAAHGYLISNFLSKYSNRRTDKYGGCLENRMRFLLEIIKDTREKVGPDFPKKVQEGRITDIRYCIGCVQTCIGGNMRGENCHCLVNPELDREFELKPNPITKKKKIFIAGGGIAAKCTIR